MELLLFSKQVDLCHAWSYHFRRVPVQIIHGDFYEFYDKEGIDAVVSPANSFGLMDGGFDYVLVNIFGSYLMQSVQNRIKQEYDGEQPVGTAMVVPTYFSSIKYVIHSPTMRTPMIIRGTNNCYLSTRAALLAAKKNPDIKKVAMTGMGTYSGGLDLDFAAKQMKVAYDMAHSPMDDITWNSVNELTKRLN